MHVVQYSFGLKFEILNFDKTHKFLNQSTNSSKLYPYQEVEVSKTDVTWAGLRLGELVVYLCIDRCNLLQLLA